MPPGMFPPGPGGGSGGPLPGGFGRLLKGAAIGGVIGGALSSIPLLNVLNCCFCVLNMAGAVLGIWMHLREAPNDRIANGEAAGMGAISGAIAGFMAGVIGLLMSFALGGVMYRFYRSALPRDVARAIAQTSAQGALGIVIDPFIYGAFGALAGFLAMQIFFKKNLPG